MRESICCFVVFSNLLRARDLYLLVSLMPAIFWDVFCLSFLGNSSIRPRLASTDQARGQGETLYQQCVSERNPREYCLNTSQSRLSTAFTDTCTHSSLKSKACIFSKSTKENGKCGARGRIFVFLDRADSSLLECAKGH